MDIIAFFARIFEVGVADIFSKLSHREGGVFLPADKSMVRVPKQCHVRRVGLLQDCAQRWRIGKVAVRLDHNRDISWTGVVPKLAQRVCNVLESLVSGTHNFVSENTDIGRAERVGQVDEAASVGHLLRVFLRIGIVHVGGTTDAGNAQAARRDLFA